MHWPFRMRKPTFIVFFIENCKLRYMGQVIYQTEKYKIINIRPGILQKN